MVPAGDAATHATFNLVAATALKLPQVARPKQLTRSLDPQFVPRGRVISCEFVCALCGYSMRAAKVHRRLGVFKCANCGKVWQVGLVLRVLPQHIFGSLVVDQALPRAERMKLNAKSRSRKAKIAALAKLGLADAWPEIEIDSGSGPLNRVEILRMPDE